MKYLKTHTVNCFFSFGVLQEIAVHIGKSRKYCTLFDEYITEGFALL